MQVRASNFEKSMAKLFFGYEQRTDLYNQLISLLETGMPVSDALQMAWDVASEEGKKPKDMKAVVLYEIILMIRNGETLARSLKPWVPQEDVMVFEAIENSNDFAGNLREYMIMLGKKKKIKGTIIGGLIYPTMLFALIYGIITYFGSSVVPQIAQLLPVEQWSGTALVLTFMYNFANHYALPTIIVFFAIMITIGVSLSRWSGAGRVMADKFPFYSTYRMYTGISFLMSMASLLQGGMAAPDALNRLHPQASPYVKHRILRIRNQMLNGSNFGAALHRAGTDWPDRKMNLNIKIFAETQDLDAQLSRLAKNWIDLSQENVEKAMAVFRTVAMMMVFATIMSIIGGVYGLQDQISQSMGGGY